MKEKFSRLDIDIRFVGLDTAFNGIFSDGVSMCKNILRELFETPEHSKFISLLQHLLSITLRRNKDEKMWFVLA